MKKDFSFPSADGRTNIYVQEWTPQGDIKGVVQISHGMVEYIDRYDEFACYLRERGFYVVGQDHLGHGHSVVCEEDLGYFSENEGNECLLKDMNKLYALTKEKFPRQPYFMVGHSMGSFLLRQYLHTYRPQLSGAILIGTGAQPMAKIVFGLGLTRSLAAIRGWRHRSVLVRNLALGSYNKRIEKANTWADWISNDEEIVKKYVADPWCIFKFTLNAYHQMFLGMRTLTKKNTKKVPKELPILIVSGKEDPVGGYGKEVAQVAKMYRETGHENLSVKLYPNARHEILNETDRGKVFNDIENWMIKLREEVV